MEHDAHNIIDAVHFTGNNVNLSVIKKSLWLAFRAL
jgi:hypothetical protein